MKLAYQLNGSVLEIDVPDNADFVFGQEELLVDKWRDITVECDWFAEGYTTLSYANALDCHALVNEITDVVRARLATLFPRRELSGFNLTDYHKFVTIDEHKSVADRVMKRLYCKDLKEVSKTFASFISDQLGHPLGFRQRDTDFEQWIIVRINPPGSVAYNPVHKDIYEEFDTTGTCSRMVNAWIPIAGVNSRAGLGVASGSHLICESKVLRTRAGSEMNGQNFSVNCIKSWSNAVSLCTVAPPVGHMLLFSSHLIHGLGINTNEDTTRVALEFRLHSQEPLR